MLPVAAFLESAAASDALAFTTFSLDEQVLVELLRQRVPRNRRIVVFHDVMKHHAPGFLRQHYPNSLVVSVQLVQHRAPVRSCPVFHSKIWLAVGRRPLRCRALAAPSLTRASSDTAAQT